MFEEEYKKIIEQIKEEENYAVMSTICENVVDLLKENGVEVQGTIYKKGGFVVDGNELSYIGEVHFSGLDFTEHDRMLEAKFRTIINEQKKQIGELEEKLSAKQETELSTMPIDVASMLINATVEYPTKSFQKAFGAGETSFADKYSKSDLREIAEHLIVFCNNDDEED